MFSGVDSAESRALLDSLRDIFPLLHQHAFAAAAQLRAAAEVPSSIVFTYSDN